MAILLEQFLEDLDLEIRPAAFECEGQDCEICFERREKEKHIEASRYQ